MRKVHASKKCWSVAQKYPIDKCTLCLNGFYSPTVSSVSHKGEGEREEVQKVSKLFK